jgi:hypothetical protein
MLTVRKLHWMAILITVLCCHGVAGAQEHLLIPDPFEFDPDFQFFAPAEFSDYGSDSGPPTGFFFTYDRLYMFTTRPQQEVGQQRGHEDWDSSWANRFEFGYMTDDDCGWLISATRLHSPNVTFVEGGSFEDIDLVISDITSATINDLRYDGVEINRVWRRPMLHKGAFLEPFVGLRLNHLTSVFKQSETFEITETVDTGETEEIPDPENPDETITVPIFAEITNSESTIHEINSKNRMYGGQVGFRLVYPRSRWVYTTEVRAFGLANYQQLVLVGFDSDGQREFVVGGELRFGAAYMLTRDISVRFGMEYLHFARGIARAIEVPSQNDEDVGSIGTSFGLTVKR